MLVWPDRMCRGAVEVTGRPLPADPPPPQRPPRNGTAPRIGHARAAARAARLPHVLLGWVGAGWLAPPGLVPSGGRRAGLTAHWFSRSVIGQNQRKHTGWLEAGDELVYSPHTQSNYRFPESMTLYRLVSGARPVTRGRRRGS